MMRYWKILLLMTAFWVMFQVSGRTVIGYPMHMEGWFDEEGREMTIVYMGDDIDSITEYAVYNDELICIYTERGETDEQGY